MDYPTDTKIITPSLDKKKVLENLSEETKDSINEYLDGQIGFDKVEGVICYDPYIDRNGDDFESDGDHEFDWKWREDTCSLTSFYFALLRIQRMLPELKKDGEIRGIYYNYWF